LQKPQQLKQKTPQGFPKKKKNRNKNLHHK
jgi:hypothetical protein